MDLQQMEYVLAVAKYRNFTLAAESCFISQSSLSLHISKLEKELGYLLAMLRDEGEEATFRYLKESVLPGKPFPWEEEG